MSASVKKLLHNATAAHQSGSLKKADTLYRKILSREPAHAETLHMRGVLKFQEGNYPYAKQLLSDAQKTDPDNPWIRYHQGDLYRTTGELELAEKHLIQALQLGAKEGDVYFTLANVQFEKQQYPAALENYQAALSRTDTDLEYRLNLANCYEKLNALDKAIEHLSIVASTGKDQATHLQLIDLLARNGDFLQVSEQISHLPASNQIDSNLLIQTTRLLLEADRAEDASRLLDIVITLELSSESQESLSLITGLLINVGRYTDARQVLTTTAHHYTLDAVGNFQLGLCEQTNGEFESAIRFHRQALQLDPSFGRAAYSLAINGKPEVTKTELDQWHEQATSNQQSAENKIQFLFATARTLDAQGETEPAFAAYEKANSLHHMNDPFDPDKWDAYIDSIIENFSSEYFSNIQSLGDGGANLTFIVGMPRSGSTLLEYQLTRHFKAKALGEHPTVRRLFMDLPRITGQNLPVAACAHHLTEAHVEYLRSEYLESINRHNDNTLSSNGDANSQLVSDKMLGNFLRLGMLAAMFPEARILHCAREAEATSVSCYTNLFARGLKFTYDLYGLGRAWQSYKRLMDHWHTVLPMPLYDVQYERLVTEPDKVFAEISTFLDHPIHTPDSKPEAGAINTASFYQARQPISTKSLHGWTRFEPYLDPLMRGLGR